MRPQVTDPPSSPAVQASHPACSGLSFLPTSLFSSVSVHLMEQESVLDGHHMKLWEAWEMLGNYLLARNSCEALGRITRVGYTEWCPQRRESSRPQFNPVVVGQLWTSHIISLNFSCLPVRMATQPSIHSLTHPTRIH